MGIKKLLVIAVTLLGILGCKTDTTSTGAGNEVTADPQGKAASVINGNSSIEELRKQARVVQKRITNIMNRPGRQNLVEERKDITKKIRDTKNVAEKKTLEAKRKGVIVKISEFDKNSGLSDLISERDDLRKRISALNKS